MNRLSRAAAVLVVTLVGVWGCSQGPTNRAALAERVKHLEERNGRLESDLRAVTTARDQIRQQLARAEDHIQKLQVVVKERDELKVTLKVRTGERDQVAGQYEAFRKTLKDTIGQAESSVLRFPDGEPVTVSVSAPESPKVRDF
jgi:outer membrane murein-binding lipoprotein Lpp